MSRPEERGFIGSESGSFGVNAYLPGAAEVACALLPVLSPGNFARRRSSKQSRDAPETLAAKNATSAGYSFYLLLNDQKSNALAVELTSGRTGPVVTSYRRIIT